MKWAVDLLKQKNNYLVQFEKISSLEYHRMQSGNHNNIKQFYYSRQIILDAIASIDKHLNTYQTQDISEEDKKTVLSLLQQKRKITLAILQTDILIHSYLNNLQYDVVEDQIA